MNDFKPIIIGSKCQSRREKIWFESKYRRISINLCFRVSLHKNQFVPFSIFLYLSVHNHAIISGARIHNVLNFKSLHHYYQPMSNKRMPSNSCSMTWAQIVSTTMSWFSKHYPTSLINQYSFIVHLNLANFIKR